MLLPLPEWRRSGIMRYVTSAIWFLSLARCLRDTSILLYMSSLSPFCCWVVFHCMNESQFESPFSRRETFRFLQFRANINKAALKHSHAGVNVNRNWGSFFTFFAYGHPVVSAPCWIYSPFCIELHFPLFKKSVNHICGRSIWGFLFYSFFLSV